MPRAYRLSLRWLALALSLALAFSATAEDPDGMFKTATLEFVADVTGNDEKLSKQVRAAFARPDRSPEAVGFYLDDDVTDEEVAFRTAIKWLSDAGYIHGFEDKYVNEMLHVLLRDKVLPEGGLSRPTKKFVDQISELYEEPARREAQMARRLETAVQEIETLSASQGKYLLSLDLGGGDTHFIIPVDEATFEKWHNVDFGHDLAVTEVAWSLIWESIAYYVFDTEGSLPYEAPTLRRLEAR